MHSIDLVHKEQEMQLFYFLAALLIKYENGTYVIPLEEVKLIL